MEVYRAETREILQRFKERRCTYAECTAALDAATAGAVMHIKTEELPALRAVMRENNQLIVSERAAQLAQAHRVGGNA